LLRRWMKKLPGEGEDEGGGMKKVKKVIFEGERRKVSEELLV
jgi:hypothetical protein